MSLDICLKDPTATYKTEDLYWGNITHNLGEMADAAGIYTALWRPEVIGAECAKDISVAVEEGLADLKARPDHYKQYNSPNGWGMYVDFVPFVGEYLEALKKYPEAKIEVNR